MAFWRGGYAHLGTGSLIHAGGSLMIARRSRAPPVVVGTSPCGSAALLRDDRPAQPGSHKGDGQDGQVSWPVWGAGQYGRGGRSIPDSAALHPGYVLGGAGRHASCAAVSGCPTSFIPASSVSGAMSCAWGQVTAPNAMETCEK